MPDNKDHQPTQYQVLEQTLESFYSGDTEEEPVIDLIEQIVRPKTPHKNGKHPDASAAKSKSR